MVVVVRVVMMVVVHGLLWPFNQSLTESSILYAKYVYLYGQETALVGVSTILTG